MAISAKELAKILNVSAATISMVFNDKPGISESTKKVVLKAAEKYGYSFSKKQTQELPASVLYLIIYKKHGNVLTDTPFFSQVIEGINNQCCKHNCQLHVTYFYEKELNNAQLNMIVRNDCRGILLLGTEMEASDFEVFSRLKLPIVIIDSYFEEIDCDSVLINNVQGAYLATKYLIDKGHQKIGYLNSSIPISNFYERSVGYFKALRQNGIQTENQYIARVSPTAEQAYIDMMNYLDGKPELATAYFADNDIIAASALRAFREHGYRIPEDISIIGFDDMPICLYTDPQLTTMYVPKQKLGALAVDRIIEKAARNCSDDVKIELRVKLIERESVCCKED